MFGLPEDPSRILTRPGSSDQVAVLPPRPQPSSPLSHMRVNLKHQHYVFLSLPGLEIGVTWSGFDPQLTPMKAARATAAAAGLLACSICCCNGLLGLLQVTALSHSSIPQFQAWLHPLSPLTTHHLPSSSQNLLPLPPPFTFPPLPFPPRKDPTAPSAACLGAKHLCGSGWPTLPGSQVAVGRHQGPHFQFPSRASATRPASARLVRASSGLAPDRPHPDQIRYSNSTRQVLQASSNTLACLCVRISVCYKKERI